ncbi:acetyl-CoA carboxylase biotin carboxylase subunit [Mycoplasmatota bacterium]|nr:acetyl-CoA carboxylase biotin carboxylase subunit [Mycoplasmatota bacterium]
MKRKILIANRGEIAVRIIRAARELSIKTVAIYSTADANSLHVKLADESVCIGPHASSESYLKMTRILSAAIATGCTAIHPGYGFLSENAAFVEMVESCGLIFIGPDSKTIRQIGDKSSAKTIAKSVHVPVIEGSDGLVENLEDGLKISKKIGYPVMIKASSGGGGRGISIVYNPKEFKEAFFRTGMEAKSNFGDDALYIEKYIEEPRHIEIQVMCDHQGHCVHLYERDCSMQRRNQKMIEESPSPFISDMLRRKMGQTAVKLVKAIQYKNAGTIEFLVDKEQNYYFIEMNTRIQVEHPITEMVTGIDLVKEQIKVAYGLPLSFDQRKIRIKGHSIECRINAEDPLNQFRPTPGLIKNMIVPGGFGIRLDTHIYPLYEVPPFYDSLLAKLIVYAPTRKEAIKKMRMALEQFVIEGIKTNIEFQYLIMHHTDYIKGHYDTGFISKFLKLVEENK